MPKLDVWIAGSTIPKVRSGQDSKRTIIPLPNLSVHETPSGLKRLHAK